MEQLIYFLICIGGQFLAMFISNKTPKIMLLTIALIASIILVNSNLVIGALWYIVSIIIILNIVITLNTKFK